jgi:hypothetical protein
MICTRIQYMYIILYTTSNQSSRNNVVCIIILNFILCIHAVTCNLPIQLLYRPVVVDAGSQHSPPIEGQFITYTCPPGFILTGPNMSVCTGNREWEPDPGEVDCIGNTISSTIQCHVHVVRPL